MSLTRTVIFFLSNFFLFCHALRCTTNFSNTYNLTQPFVIPDQCSQIVSAGKCTASVTFSFDRQEYTVQFHADPSVYISGVDNTRHAYMSLLSTNSLYFSYTIEYGCKNKDDCARDLVRDGLMDILERQFPISNIKDELLPLISSSALPPNNSHLLCYVSNEQIRQCGTSSKPGSCFISHHILGNTMNRTCSGGIMSDTIAVSMYQSSNHITFNIYCNRTLCNENSTLQAVKNLLFNHNVTVTLDGQLGTTGNIGSKLLVPNLFLIMMIYFLFLN
jgi:hypothetical protein